MTGTFFKLLMAASALVPVAATAQRLDADVALGAEGRGERGARMAERLDVDAVAPRRVEHTAPDMPRPERADAPRAREDRGGFRADRSEGRRPDVPGEREVRGDGGRDRGERYGRGRADPVAARVDVRPDSAADPRGGWRGRRDDRPDVRQDYRQAGRDRQDYGRARPDDARRFAGNRDDRRDGVRGHNGGYGDAWSRNGGYEGRGGNARAGYADRRAWNRDWRSDRRYAWSDYRAANRGAYRLPRYYAPNGWGSGYRRFGIGFTLSSILFDRNYWIEDPYTYRLPEPYGPYRWVRYYNDALLVDLDSGRVVDTVYDIFW